LRIPTLLVGLRCKLLTSAACILDRGMVRESGQVRLAELVAALSLVMSFKRFDTCLPAFPMRRVRAHKR
jgi:hypothetical protein